MKNNTNKVDELNKCIHIHFIEVLNIYCIEHVFNICGLWKKEKGAINMDNNNNKTNNIKTQSIRMRELDKQYFDEIKKEKDLHAEEVMTLLMDKYRNDEFVSQHSQHEKSIGDFERYTNAVRGIFQGLISECENQEQLIRTEVENDIKSKEKMIIELNNKVFKFESDIKDKNVMISKSQKEIDDLNAENALLRKTNESLQENLDNVESFKELFLGEKEKNAVLTKQNEEEVKKLNEGKAAISAQLEEVENSKSILIETLNKTQQSLDDSAIEIDRLKEENQSLCEKVRELEKALDENQGKVIPVVKVVDRKYRKLRRNLV